MSFTLKTSVQWNLALPLLKGLYARVKCKTEDIKTVLCDSITQIRPFWSLIVMASTWLKTEFGVVKWTHFDMQSVLNSVSCSNL